MEKKKALIVIDMQNDFVMGSLANPAAEKIVKLIARKIRAFDGTIIATRDTHEADYLTTPEGQKLPVEHCIRNTDGWRLVPEIESELAKKKDFRYINKPTFGMATEWNLGTYDEVEVVGTCTDICVVSNVLILKALYPRLMIKVHSRLCAGLTEEKHLAALEVMRSCQVEVV